MSTHAIDGQLAALERLTDKMERERALYRARVQREARAARARRKVASGHLSECLRPPAPEAVPPSPAEDFGAWVERYLRESKARARARGNGSFTKRGAA